MSNNDIIPDFDQTGCDFLSIELHKVPNVEQCLLLQLKGQIDTYSNSFLQDSATRVIEAGFARLILDLAEVDYLSSKAVGVLMQIRKAVTAKGGEIAIIGVHPRIQSVFRNLGLDRILRAADSMDNAIAQMIAGS